MTELEVKKALNANGHGGAAVSVAALLADYRDTSKNPEATLQDLMRTHLSGRDITQTTAARQIGCSAAAFNQWLQGKYKGDNTKLEAQITVWLGGRDDAATIEGALAAAPDYIPTPTSAKIEAALAYAQYAGDLAVIHGGAGVGKTSTIRHYARQNPQVFTATMTAADKGVVPALEEISEAVGIRDTSSGARRMSKAIIARIRDTRGLLVVDEAQHLGVDALEQLRAIHDATGIGLALVGNETVYASLTGGRRAETFAQLFSRVGKRTRLGRPSGKDIDAIADAMGIDDKAARKYLREIGVMAGALRGVVKVVRHARMMASSDGADLTLDHLRDAWVDLGADG